MNLIELSLRRPVFAWIVMAALIIFGAISLSRLGVSQLPDVDFPVISVSVDYEGAAPEIIESEIVDRLESSLLAIEGINEMRSSVKQGQGSVRLEFDINRNVDVVAQEVQTAVSQVRFPLGVEPPVVRKTNPEEEPIMYVALSADVPLREVIAYADKFLLDQFRFLPDIGEVNIAGFSVRNLRVWPRLAKLKNADLTILDLMETINSQHVEAAAGQFVEGQRELRVRWRGEADSVEGIGKLRILRRGGATIQDTKYTVADVADVEDGLSDIRKLGRVNGRETMTFAIRKQRGKNEVALADSVLKKIAELKALMPPGYSLVPVVNFTAPTRAVVNTTMEKLVVAALVTIVVCFLFLGSWQAALNILFSIPTSILGTFLILYFCGFTLNLFSLLALTLAVSIVVDDAIMLLENIVRHFRMGKTPQQAAFDGATEILPAATAATLAVVAVFAPVIFMSGITGKFFYQFGITMSAAVLLSLLEAVTITPMRAAAFMAASPKVSKFERRLEGFFDRLAEGYRRLLSRLLSRAWVVVSVAGLLFFSSLLLVRQVKQEFVPPQDQNFIVLTSSIAPGASLEANKKVSLEMEKVLTSTAEVKGYMMSIGGGGGGNNQVNSTFVAITLVPRETRKATHFEIMDRFRKEFKKIPGLKVSLRDISSRSLTTGRMFPFSANLSGPDLEVLNEKGQELIQKLTNEGLIQDGDMDFRKGIPELQIEPLREELAARGVSISDVARTLNAAVAGVRQSRFTADGRRYDIRVKVPEFELKDRRDFSQITVRNQFGNLVNLGDLVSMRENGTIQTITRINRQRAVGVFGQLGRGQSQAKVLARAQVLAREILPVGYAFRLEGASAGLTESFASLTWALGMGILVAYMILAIQFNSFIHPVSVLMALPFSVTGALLGLWLFGVSLNLFSFIGLIVLMGIAKKNSILLVQFTNQVRGAKQISVREALVEACPVRLRPILMTSTATVAAALPLVIGNSLGQETRTPMGLAIIGGTVLSTILTLFVVPAIYLILSGLEAKRRGGMQLSPPAPVDQKDCRDS